MIDYEHVLLIEEEKGQRYVLSNAFQAIERIRLSTVDDPRQAIGVARLTSPKVVIAEIFYPNSGGYLGADFFHALRKEAPGVKLIITSTLSDENIQAEFLVKIKAQCYLNKPYDLEFLLRRCCELLDIQFPNMAQ